MARRRRVTFKCKDGTSSFFPDKSMKSVTELKKAIDADIQRLEDLRFDEKDEQQFHLLNEKIISLHFALGKIDEFMAYWKNFDDEKIQHLEKRELLRMIWGYEK